MQEGRESWQWREAPQLVMSLDPQTTSRWSFWLWDNTFPQMDCSVNKRAEHCLKIIIFNLLLKFCNIFYWRQLPRCSLKGVCTAGFLCNKQYRIEFFINIAYQEIEHSAPSIQARQGSPLDRHLQVCEALLCGRDRVCFQRLPVIDQSKILCCAGSSNHTGGWVHLKWSVDFSQLISNSPSEEA